MTTLRLLVLAVFALVGADLVVAVAHRDWWMAAVAAAILVVALIPIDYRRTL